MVKEREVEALVEYATAVPVDSLFAVTRGV